MKKEELITDNAIEIVFENINFGTKPLRDIVDDNLIKVEQGWAIGYTAECCLLELGLIFRSSKRELETTKVGDKYLELLKQ